MSELWLAAAAFLVSHVALSSRPLRDPLVRTLGERPFQGLYSLVAIGLLVWLLMAFGAAPPGPLLWSLGPVGDVIALVLMPLAVLLLVGGVSQPNPTAVGGDRFLASADPARGVLRITRNPVMWSIGLWGLAHLAAGGDLRHVILFATLTILALAGTMSIEAKARRRRGVAFEAFAAATSNVPFQAVLQGRQSLAKAAAEFGAVRLTVVVVLYGALLVGHSWLFGVSAYPVFS